MVSFIIDFSRNYVNKNKKELDQDLLETGIFIIEKITNFFILKENNYNEVLREIRVKYNKRLLSYEQSTFKKNK